MPIGYPLAKWHQTLVDLHYRFHSTTPCICLRVEYLDLEPAADNFAH